MSLNRKGEERREERHRCDERQKNHARTAALLRKSRRRASASRLRPFTAWAFTINSASGCVTARRGIIRTSRAVEHAIEKIGEEFMPIIKAA